MVRTKVCIGKKKRKLPVKKAKEKAADKEEDESVGIQTRKRTAKRKLVEEEVEGSTAAEGNVVEEIVEEGVAGAEGMEVEENVEEGETVAEAVVATLVGGMAEEEGEEEEAEVNEKKSDEGKNEDEEEEKREDEQAEKEGNEVENAEENEQAEKEGNEVENAEEEEEGSESEGENEDASNEAVGERNEEQQEQQEVDGGENAEDINEEAEPARPPVILKFRLETIMDECGNMPGRITFREKMGKTLSLLKSELEKDEDLGDMIVEANLGHFLDLDDDKWVSASGNFMHFFLLRQIKCKKLKELWFLIGNKPIKFGLQEFCLSTGLRCGPYPSAADGDKVFVDGYKFVENVKKFVAKRRKMKKKQKKKEQEKGKEKRKGKGKTKETENEH